LLIDFILLPPFFGIIRDTGNKVIPYRLYFCDEKWEQQTKQRDIHAFYNPVVSSGKDITALAGLLEKGILKPYISRIFNLEEIPLAHKEIEGNHTTGEVVISLP